MQALLKCGLVHRTKLMPKSFTKLYWLAWFVSLCLFIVALAFYGGEASIGWFVLLSSLLGGCAFNFEFGRLMGFLKSHVPSVYSKLPTSSRWFEVSVFFNPKLLRIPDSNAPHYHAMKIYRASWQFSVVAMLFPLLVNWAVNAYIL